MTETVETVVIVVVVEIIETVGIVVTVGVHETVIAIENHQQGTEKENRLIVIVGTTEMPATETAEERAEVIEVIETVSRKHQEKRKKK